MADRIRPPGSRAWQGREVRPSADASSRARRRLALVVLALILVLSGILAAVLLYPRALPQAHFVALGIDQYRDERLPAPLWTGRDCAALRRVGWKDQNAFTSQERGLLVQELKNLGRSQPKDQPLVVYLCARAVVAEDGGVAVLPGDCRLDDPATWLPLADVLESLRACPVQHKLLLLDLAQPCAEPRAGVLTNDVPERLEAELRTAADQDPHLQVLCACSPGQVSLASEDLGHTVFAHYLIQGLAGQKVDPRVTVRGLTAFVTDRVDRWAWHNRRLRQTPQFFGPDTDHALLVGGQAPAEETALEAEYPGWLTRGWKLRERWRAEVALSTPPRLYRELEQALLRAEDRWRGGDKVEDVRADLDTRLTRVERERNTGAAPDLSEPSSLAEAVARGREVPRIDVGDALRDLKNLADLHVRVSTPRPGEKPSEKDQARLAKAREEFLAPFEGKRFQLAWTVFHAALADRNPRPEHLRYWHGLLATEKEPPPRYAEIVYLGRLGELTADKPGDWPALAVADALQTAAEAEQARAAGAMDSAWAGALYRQAQRRREDGEKLLFGPAAGRGKAAEPLAAALREFRGLNESLQALQQAEKARDDALDLLPGYAPYLEHEPKREATWQKALEMTLSLRDTLARPTDKAPPEVFRRLSEEAASLRDNLNNLRQPVETDRVGRLIGQSPKGGGADAREMSGLLRLPALAASDRSKLYSAWRDLTGRLAETEPPDAPPPFDRGRALREERERGLLRARASLALLRLAGAEDTVRVEAALKKAAESPADAAAWQGLRQELRKGWQRRQSK
jgi:hypothetical protein